MKKRKGCILLLITVLIAGCNTTPPQPEQKPQEKKPVVQETQKPARQPEPVVPAKQEKKEPEAPRQEEKNTVTTGFTVYFAPNMYTIDTFTAYELDKIAVALKNNKVKQIRIVGHTAKLNTVKAEEKLSMQRAIAVARYFQSIGLFDAADITVSAAAGTEPAGSHAEITERRNNRRVEIHY